MEAAPAHTLPNHVWSYRGALPPLSPLSYFGIPGWPITRTIDGMAPIPLSGEQQFPRVGGRFPYLTAPWEYSEHRPTK